MDRRRIVADMLAVKHSSPRLPSTYQEVEWIKGGKSQSYIDTGIIPQNHLSIEIKYSLKSQINAIFGCQYSSSYFTMASNDSRVFAYFGNTNVQNLFIYNQEDIYIHEFIFNDNVLSGSFSSVNIGTNYPSIPLYLFNSNGWTVDSNITIYYAKVKLQDNYIAYLVPCYRKIDEVIGLYDIIRNIFIPASDNSCFSKGNDVI